MRELSGTGANMTNELSKTISTCAIWFATAAIFIFGVFRMNGDFLFFLFAIGIIAGAAAGSTAAIWYQAAPDETSLARPPNPQKGVEQSTRATPVPDEHGISRKPGG